MNQDISSFTRNAAEVGHWSFAAICRIAMVWPIPKFYLSSRKTLVPADGSGHAAKTNEFAKQNAIELIVIGSRGLGDVKGLLLGRARSTRREPFEADLTRDVAMLQINPDKVCFVVVNAREFQAQEEATAEDAGAGAGDEDFRSVLLAYPDDPTYGELVAFIDALNVDEQAELVALAWLGRGDYVTTEWDQAVKDAADRHTGSTAEYLLGIPLLPDYLEGALNQLDYSCDDFER